MVTQLLDPSKVIGKTVSISPRQRLTLQKLLIGNQRKCSATALCALERRGWVHGPETGYQLTETGWHIAELSEEMPQGRRLELQMSN